MPARQRQIGVKVYAWLLVGFLFAGSAAALDTETILGKMDEASAQFRGMTAEVEWISYTALVDDKSVESGQLWVRRKSPKEAILKISFDKPSRKDLLVDVGNVQIFRPKINTVEEYDVSKSRDKLEQALLLSFGASGEYINEHYEPKLVGEDEVAGEKTAKLELVPRDAGMRRSVPKIEMWVSTKSWQAVQQKLYQDSDGDYRLYSYRNIKLNPQLRDADFRLDMPRNVKRVKSGQ